MAAGAYNLRCRFERQNASADDYGNTTDGVWAHLVTVWGRLEENTGDETGEAGGLQSEVRGVLSVRRTGLTENLKTGDRVQVSGALFNIRSISTKQRDGKIVIAIERGVAT